MHESKQLKTKWTVTNLSTGYYQSFNCEEDARSYALTCGGNLAIRAPLYG